MSGSLECSSAEQFRDKVSRDSAGFSQSPHPVAPNTHPDVSKNGAVLTNLFGNVRWLTATLCVCFGLACRNLPGQGTIEPQKPDPVIGWQGTYLVGSWTEVAFEFDAPDAGDYEIRVTAPDPDGHRVTFASSTRLPQKGPHVVRGYFKVGQWNPAVEVSVFAADTAKSLWSWKSSLQSGTRLLDPGSQLIVTVGNPSGFDWSEAKSAEKNDSGSIGNSGIFRVVAATVDDLPVGTRAYDAVSMLVIAGRSILSAEQAGAVRDWVVAGGRLTISLPADVTSARQILEPFVGWLPVTLSTDPLTVSEFGKLEKFAGKNVRIPLKGRMRVPGLKFQQGEVLAGSPDEALLVRCPFGLGSVKILALDLTQPPLTKWTEIAALGSRLSQSSSDGAENLTGPPRKLQLSSTGVTDLATQLHAAQEDFSQIHRASPWLVMGLLVAILLVVGPLDYLVAHRLLKWPRATWVTLPVWVICAGVICAALAAQWNGSAFRFNQLNVLTYDVGTSTCHQRLWTNLYSPATGRSSVSIRSAIATDPPKSGDSFQSGWSGVPESAYGGMLRPSGVNVGSADYSTAGPVIRDLPLMQWSSKALMTEIHSSVSGMVDSDLQSNGVGQLSGTLTHRFSGPIEDWFLAYGNRVYRHKKTRDDPKSIPLLSRQTLRIDQPNVHPRELRAFLIGKVAASKQQQGSKTSDILNQFTTYDAMSRDPAEALRILTFHDEAGGTRYTGLTNRLLEHEDLSHLLSLGRAILFGRLDSSVASMRLDGTDISADREMTFIRIILPVKKVGGGLTREIEKFDK